MNEKWSGDMLKLCVDIGGTKTIVGVVNEELDIIDSNKFETIKESPEQQFAQIINYANQFVESYEDIETNVLNIAMPGPCDYTKGLFLNPPNLQQYNQFNAGAYITQHSQFSPKFVNDTDAAALAEYQYIKSEANDFVYLTISTGVGMAYVKDGKLISGVDGNFGEIGHTVIKNNSDYQCPVCHQYGCVENEISGLAISRKASTLLERPVTTREAINMYMQHDNEAVFKMVDEVINLTQQLCNNIFSIFNIYHIVLGGGVTQSPLPYKETLGAYIRKHNLIQNSSIQIDISSLEANVLTGLYFIN